MQLSANRIPSFSLCLPSLCQPSLCASALRARTAAIRKAGIKMRLALFLAGLLAIPPVVDAIHYLRHLACTPVEDPTLKGF